VPTPEPGEPLPGLGLTILVVEDSRDVGAILAAALEDEGCRALVARTGSQALDLARRTPPDLITLDLALPGMSGLDLLAQLRVDPATRHIPIVAVSGHTAHLDPVLARQVARVIGKPFYLSDVVSAVLQTLGRAQS
jgi:CheY-like chemotaxis protein